MYGNNSRGRGRTSPESWEDGIWSRRGGSCGEARSRSKNRQAYSLWWRIFSWHITDIVRSPKCHVPYHFLFYTCMGHTHLRLHITSATNPKLKPPESRSIPSHAPTAYSTHQPTKLDLDQPGFCPHLLSLSGSFLAAAPTVSTA